MDNMFASLYIYISFLKGRSIFLLESFPFCILSQLRLMNLVH